MPAVQRAGYTAQVRISHEGREIYATNDNKVEKLRITKKHHYRTFELTRYICSMYTDN